LSRRDYTAEEIDLGLTYLAMAAGNDRAAARELKAERGLTIPRTTLRDWKVRKTDDYTAIRSRLEQKRREEMAEHVTAISQKELEAADLAIDQLIDGLKAGTVAAKDLPKALRDLKLSFGIGTDKANVLLDRPTTIVGHSYDLPTIEAAIRGHRGSHRRGSGGGAGRTAGRRAARVAHAGTAARRARRSTSRDAKRRCDAPTAPGGGRGGCRLLDEWFSRSHMPLRHFAPAKAAGPRPRDY
jgi:hypothetical protein